MAGDTQSGTKRFPYDPEIADTLKSVGLREHLQYDLDITEREYRSDHSIAAEFFLKYEPTKTALKNRQSAPKTPLSLVGKLIGQGLQLEGYPGTRAHVGFTKSWDEERESSIEPTVEGIPIDDTLTFDCDWGTQELKEAQAEGEVKTETRKYDISGYPTEGLPIIVRAELYRDAVELLRKIDSEHDRDASHQREKDQRERIRQERRNKRAEFEGQSALAIELKNRQDIPNPQTIHVNEFSVDMDRTFPDIAFRPEHGSTYNPQQKRIKWTGSRIQPGDIEYYVIIGPIGQLLDIGHVSAQLTGKIANATLSGLDIAAVYDESGDLLDGRFDIVTEVDLGCYIEIDPDALSGQVQRKTKSTLHVIGIPEEIYTELEDLCRREGIHIRNQSRPADAEPAPDREGVWVVRGKKDRGELDVKREYGNKGVVYATILVTGEYTPSSKEQHVSSSESGSDKLVRSDSGALDSRGRTTIEIDARSASSELNNEFINTFEEAFPGGEAK